MNRRTLLLALPVAGAFSAAARAQVTVPELAVACDMTLGPALQAIGAAYGNVTGVRVSVFPTEPGLILPQLLREVQNDVLVTQVATMEMATRHGVVAAGTAQGAWRNRLVLAAKRGTTAPLDGPIAVTDGSAVSDMDGAAILAQLGLRPATTLGVIDTATVAALLADGTAKAGLLHMTDVRARDGLEVIRSVADTVHPPLVYASAVTTLARRPNPSSFIAFLAMPLATALLATLGLETGT